MIKLDKGNFYLEDNNSKFGTLLHMKRPFALFGDYNNISLQIGRTVLSLAVKKNWKSLSNVFGYFFPLALSILIILKKSWTSW